MAQLLLKDVSFCLFFSYPRPHDPLLTQAEVHGN